MEYDSKQLDRILIENEIPGQEIKLILGKDGTHLASQGLEEDEEDIFSAMCATLYGAGEAAFFSTERGAPDYFEIISENSRLILLDAGEHALVAAMVSSEALTPHILRSMRSIAGEVRSIG